MFFSVTKPVKIAGKSYIPCVCYPLPEPLKYTIECMKKESKAEVYDKVVFFQNGKLVEPEIKSEKIVEEKKSRKEKKVKTVEVKNIEEPAEEAGITVAEKSDESEGF